MIHPIYHVALHKPGLLLKHLSNYVELVRYDLTSLGISLAARAAGLTVAVVALLFALGFSGMALMLGFLLGSFHPVLVIVPGAAWLVALSGGWFAFRSGIARARVNDVQQELQLDLALLHLIKAAKDD